MAVVLFFLASMPAASWSASEDDKPVSWAWVEKNRKRPPQEILDYYRGHPDEFAVIPLVPSDNPIEQAFFLASIAYSLNAPEYRKLVEKADEAADAAVLGSDWIVALQAAHAHNKLMQAAVRASDYDLALELADKGRRRTETLKSNPKLDENDPAAINKIYDIHQSAHLRMIARSLGDFAELERLIREEMQENENHIRKTLAGLKKMGSDTRTLAMMEGLQKMQSRIHLPELAEALARQGKMDVAKALMIQYVDRKKEEKGEAVAMLKGFLEGALAAKDGITFAEIWLTAGDPAKALDALAPVEKGIQHFAKIASKGSAEYVTVAQGKHNSIKARCFWLLGRTEEALKGQEAALKALDGLPRSHPDVIRERQQLLWAKLALGKDEDVRQELPALAVDQMEMVENLLGFASERQRMVYLQQADPFSLLVAMGETQRLAEAVLRLKGIVLDSLLEERRMLRLADTGEAAEWLAKLKEARENLSDASLAGAAEAPELRAEVEILESKLASLTRSQLSSREALSVTVAKLQEALTADDALVEFITYRHLVKPGQWEPHYGAVIVRAGQLPAWVALGSTAQVDQAINSLLHQVSVEVPETQTEAVLQSLHQRLIQPLEPYLRGAKRLVLSPDGGLSRLSFAVLRTPAKQFLAEQWELAYVSTGRDLLRHSTPPPAEADMLILADPDLNLATGENQKLGYAKSTFLAFDRESLQQLPSLPGAALEMQRIQELGVGQGLRVTALTGAAASEAALSALAPSPAYLHFATHGTVLAPTRSVQVSAQREGFEMTRTATTAVTELQNIFAQPLADNPLQRAVLVLAGANSTFSHWKAGRLPPAAEDGVLTAEELAAKNLDNTWLCVLSACETAAGTPLSGEGVLGMRRGLFLAGVDHLVMTFWAISDDSTVELMSHFYQEIGRQMHPAQAMHKVQRDALIKWQREKGLAYAVILAGPFALSTTGKLPSL